MNEIVFEEPPSRGPRGAWAYEVVRQLRANPDAWARVAAFDKAERASATAYAIKNGLNRAWGSKGDFEAAARKVEGEHRVYARYVGEDA